MTNIEHSKADNPDLDWSQVRETVLMLNLAMARMTHAMRDGDESVDQLGRSFTEKVGHIKFMQELIRANYNALDRDKQMFEDLLQGKVSKTSCSPQ